MLELFIIIGGVAALLLWLLSSGKTPKVTPLRGDERGAFEKVPSVFVNGGEAALFAALRKACPGGLYVLTKVRLEDVVGVSRHIRPGQTRFALRGRVKSRHLDFVIIDGGGAPLLAIELDGRAHQGRDQNIADDVKTKLCADAGLELIRISTGDDINSAVRQIFKCL